LCATFSANVYINDRLAIKVYCHICTLRHIRIKINHGSQNGLADISKFYLSPLARDKYFLNNLHYVHSAKNQYTCTVYITKHIYQSSFLSFQILYSYSIGCIYILVGLIISGSLLSAYEFCKNVSFFLLSNFGMSMICFNISTII